MKLPPANLNHLWASLIVEELVRNGVDTFCLAPGSRCTPLTVAVAENPGAKASIHYDERGVAFHALGYGRATGRPAVVVTTSGTAVPNAMPAVVEAAADHVPLLVLTADRPPELRDSAANQTIDQAKIFGGYARWFVDLPCPDLQIPPEMVLTTIDQAVYRSRVPCAGPVHVNCMFREPLAPEPGREDFRDCLATAGSGAWLACETPYTEYVIPERRVDSNALEDAAKVLGGAKRGLALVGGLKNEAERMAAGRLLEKLQWPVCADITSGLRMGGPSGLVMGFNDVLVQSRFLSEGGLPDTVLHLGGRLVSKHVAAYVSRSRPKAHIVITGHPERQDPGHEVTLRMEGDIDGVCSDLAGRLGKQEISTWLASWQHAAGAVKKVFERFVMDADDLNEPIIAFLISQHIPPDHDLFLAGSMPVRNMDAFADVSGPSALVGANRGASGVDGTIASAAGFARGRRRPVTLLAGDLAFLHDLNSLNYLREADHPVVVVVINNNGGGIFSFLPIARFEQVFEKYFVAPHDLTFNHAANMYNLPFYHPNNRQEFIRDYQTALNANRSAIVEVRLDRQQNFARHSRLVEDMLQALDH